MEQRDALSQCPLFAKIEANLLDSLLDCLTAVKRVYRKDEFVFMAGDKATSVGIVLSGGVRVLQEDFWGHRMILAHVGRGGLFGEAFSCAGIPYLPVDIVAAEDCNIMFLNGKKLLNT